MKILIVGPNFFNYNQSIKESFEQKGHQVDIISYHESNANFLEYITNSGLRKAGIKYFYEKKLNDYNRQIKEYLEWHKVDAVLIIKGWFISEETLKLMKSKKIVTLLWMMDSITRYQHVLDMIYYFDHIFTFEPSDIDFISDQFHLHSHYLPIGYDPNTYYEIDGTKKDIDIFFAGAGYPEREEMLLKLTNQLERDKINYTIRVVGVYYKKHQFMKMLQFKTTKKVLDRIILNQNISPSAVNKYYNQSKINLNIHHPQSKLGVNPRTFEILGAGGFEIVDEKQITKEYSNQHFLTTFNNFDSLVHSLYHFIENEKMRKEYANNGKEFVLKEHTIDSRVNDILNVL